MNNPYLYETNLLFPSVCGTTKRLAQMLRDCGEKVEYTFTDISPSLVAQASKTMKEYKWMNFETFNLEESPASHLRGRFDFVIGTNCVHATRDRVDALRNVRQLLSARGCVILSEVCETVDWYDIVFGLFDGWWLSTDGSYALQPVGRWRQWLGAAGFGTIRHSQLAQRPLNIQRLILASAESLDVPGGLETSSHSAVETVVYKEVQGLKIPADIYIPRERPEAPMSLGMCHWHPRVPMPARPNLPANMSSTSNSDDDTRWGAHDAIAESHPACSNRVPAPERGGARQLRLPTMS